MLLYFIPKLKDNPFIKFLSKFTSSIWFIFFIGVLIVCSEVFAIEIYVYYSIAILCGLIPCLLCNDMTSAIPPFAMGYMSFSRINNNTLIEKSLFTNPTFINNFIVVVIICALSLISRLIVDIIFRKRVYQFPRQTLGFVILGIFYILGGLFTPDFNGKTAFFGLVQILSIGITYFLFFYLIDWRNHKKDYFAYLVITVGFVAIIETICTKFNVSELIYGYEKNENFFTGWGVSNNVGGQITFSLAGFIYLAITKKQPWIPLLLMIITLFGVCLTESRGAMITCFAASIVLIIVLLIVTKKMQRIKNICALGGIAITLGVLIPVFYNDFFHIFFDRLIETIKNSSDLNEFSTNRILLYKEGIRLGLTHPLFGNGWYACKGEISFNFATGFFPPRWHNTFIQIFASCGIFGLLAYLFHRFEFYFTFFKKPTIHKAMICCSIGVFLCASLFDCFFSNVGPGLLYGILLVMLEMSYYTELSTKKQILAYNNKHAPIAQLDRVLGFEPRGYGFESYLGRHKEKL